MTSQLSKKITLKQLLVAKMLAEHRSTHRAAETLNMTQSTVSKLLKELEMVLGAELFSRHARGVAPTDIGNQLVQFATETLTRLDRFSEDFQSKLQKGHGVLVIGAIMGAAPDLVARAVTELKTEKPGLIVRLLGETSDQILNMLEDGRLDIAVGRFSSPRHWQLFDFEPLGEEPLELVARRDHPLVGQRDLTLKALHDWPWVLQPASTPSRQLLDRAFGNVGCGTPENVVESASIFAALQLIQNSDSVALLPASVVQDHLKYNILRSLPDLIGKKIGGFGIVRRRGEILSGPAQEFASILREIAYPLP